MSVNIELALLEGVESEEREEADVLAALRRAKVSAEPKAKREPAISAVAPASVPPAPSHSSSSRPAVILKGFERNQSAPRDFHLPLIRRVADFVVANTANLQVVRGIRIVGHADGAANSQVGPQLGERRALAVLHALTPEIEGRWPGLNERIDYSTASAGGVQRLSNDPSSAARALNRRVEIFLSFGPPTVQVEYPALAWQPQPRKSSWSMLSVAPAAAHPNEQSASPAIPGGQGRQLGDHLRAAFPDGYLKAASTTDPPHRWICWLQIDFGDAGAPLTAETGLLIGPRHVLTTGHSLFTQEIDASDSRQVPAGVAIIKVPRKVVAVRVIPGRNGETILPFGSARVATASSLRNNPQWAASLATNHEFDYGLVTIEAPFSTDPGFWGGAGYRIGALSDQALQNAVVHTAGYAAREHPPASPKNLNGDADPNTNESQRSTIGVVSSVAPRTFQHDMPTEKMQIGSPVWTEDRGDRVLVGTCSGGANRALRITADMLNQIRAWMKQDGVHPSF